MGGGGSSLIYRILPIFPCRSEWADPFNIYLCTITIFVGWIILYSILLQVFISRQDNILCQPQLLRKQSWQLQQVSVSFFFLKYRNICHESIGDSTCHRPDQFNPDRFLSPEGRYNIIQSMCWNISIFYPTFHSCQPSQAGTLNRNSTFSFVQVFETWRRPPIWCWLALLPWWEYCQTIIIIFQLRQNN